MRRIPRPLRSRAGGVSLSLLLAISVACSDGTDSPSAGSNELREETNSSTDGGAATTMGTPAEHDEAARAGYREFWATFDAYAAEAAPFDPAEFRDRFGPVAGGGEYDHLYERFQLDRVRGWVTRGGESDVYRPKIVESTENRIVIEDCADDTGGIYDTRANTWIEPETPGARSFLRVVLEPSEGRWKVTSVGGKDVPCDA